jgi:ribosomal protein L16 Arg81 hydroxylase
MIFKLMMLYVNTILCLFDIFWICKYSALSFGIGGKGSGVQWHVHGPGFSESIHGKKHWVLYEPDRKPKYDPDFTSRNWMEEVYPSLPQSALPYECTLSPGEMIYFPDGWHHATINLSQYTAFISTFTTEHGL